MKHVAIALSLAVLGLVAPRPHAASAQTLFVDYFGYDYESPNPDPLQFGEPGSSYHSLGLVPNLFLPLVPDTANNEYTYYMSSLNPVNVQNFGTFIIIDYAPGGSFQVWEDLKLGGTPLDYGINPPNGTAPSSFTDGNLFVQGSLDQFQIVLNLATGSGSFEGVFTMTGGSQLSNVPANQRTGWTFAGTTANELHRPSGYDHQVDGQIFLNEPVPARPSSWGAVKARYRQ
jgi:hypothetical protein